MAEPRVYEVVLIVHPDVNEEATTTLIDTLQSIITAQGGNITKSESMGRRKFAYQIGRLTEGTYHLFEIEGTGKEIAELERRMRVSDQVIRYITVRVDEDRRRAEKFRVKRERVAQKRSGAMKVGEAANLDANGDDADVVDVPVTNARQSQMPQNRRFRRRKASQLMRDKVDIIDFKDVNLLSQYLPERGKIMPRRLSNNTAIHQRMLAEAIKRARNIALLPYVTD